MTCRLNTTSFINLSVSILNFRKSSVWTILFIFIHTDVSVSTNPRPFGAARAVSLSHRSELLNKGCWCGWTVKDAVRLSSPSCVYFILSSVTSLLSLLPSVLFISSSAPFPPHLLGFSAAFPFCLLCISLSPLLSLFVSVSTCQAAGSLLGILRDQTNSRKSSKVCLSKVPNTSALLLWDLEMKGRNMKW